MYCVHWGWTGSARRNVGTTLSRCWPNMPNIDAALVQHRDINACDYSGRHLRKPKILSQCCFSDGPTSATLAQHLTNIGSTSVFPVYAQGVHYSSSVYTLCHHAGQTPIGATQTAHTTETRQGKPQINPKIPHLNKNVLLILTKIPHLKSCFINS